MEIRWHWGGAQYGCGGSGEGQSTIQQDEVAENRVAGQQSAGCKRPEVKEREQVV